ncbi:conserved hypothetical protein [Tenacibaculum sediminilitoris]|uniref:hypothetical protein n=1 Tax=Tenacibaculum sediminilitoris TaxID=1820334 RepID=UPI0038953D31
MKKYIFIIISILSTTLYSQTTELTALGNYIWNSTDEPKTFSKKLQLSFVNAANGFPSYGTVLAGGTYSVTQDGGVFQLYFPYGESYDGNAPKIRLGKYHNQGWSNWETFYTSANANKSDIDWNVKSLNANNLVFDNSYSDPSTSPNKITLWKGGDNNYFGFGISNRDLDYFSQYNHRFYTGYNGTPGTEKMVITSSGNVGIGTINPDVKLAVNGIIHSKEVKVDLTGWPDYVFKKEYNLPTLQEVAKHIKEKGHLENIPSAKEVEKNGVKLGEMNKKLLQKIEELTLYTLQQESRLKKLEEENKNLKDKTNRIEELEKKMTAILKN